MGRERRGSGGQGRDPLGDGHPSGKTKGGRGLIDRSLAIHADCGRGKGVLCLYAAENSGGPTLELRLEQIRSHRPYDLDEGHVQLMADLRALGIPRLDAEDIMTTIRRNYRDAWHRVDGQRTVSHRGATAVADILCDLAGELQPTRGLQDLFQISLSAAQRRSARGMATKRPSAS